MNDGQTSEGKRKVNVMADVVWMSDDDHMTVSSLSDSLLGQASVPLDLVQKHPKGQQTFALMTKDTVTGSLIAEVGLTITKTLSHCGFRNVPMRWFCLKMSIK